MKNRAIAFFVIAAFPTLNAHAQKIAAGSNHAMLICVDSTIWAWGDNGSGLLGDGTNATSYVPVPVSDLTAVTDIACGSWPVDHSLALRVDGSVWAWGNNDHGQFGNGSTDDSNVPVQVPGLTGVTAIDGCSFLSLALKADSTVWSWGYNDHGQLGNGTTTDSHVPVQVSELTEVIDISANGSSCIALRRDSTVWVWGRIGSFTESHVPIQASGLDSVIAVSAGKSIFMALRYDGTVWDWGNGPYGQLGNGTFGSSPTPVQVLGLDSVIAIEGGYSTSMALRSNGTVWAWGRNFTGALGNGTNTDSAVPVEVLGMTGIVGISVANEFAMALDNTGTAWAWGWGISGLLATGDQQDSNVPLLINGACANDISVAGHSAAEAGILLWPDPSDGQFTITGLHGSAELTVTDMLGRTIYAAHTASSELNVDLRSQPKGTYAYRLTGEGGQGRRVSGTFILQ